MIHYLFFNYLQPKMGAFLPKTNPYPFQAQRLLPKVRFLHRTAGETN